MLTWAMLRHGWRIGHAEAGPGIVDVGQNGIGVAPLPVEQRTQIGTFALG